MVEIIVKDIKEISEMNSDDTRVSIGKDITELMEDEEDINEGLKALSDKEGTITWEQYQKEREDRDPQSEIPN